MINRFVIIGGGTAGWIIAHSLRAFVPKNTKITLLESPKIKTIGVGEGTTTHFWAFINRWCPYLNETEFVAKTDATFKIGSRFEDWSGPGSLYFTPNDQIGHVRESMNYWPPSFDAMRTYAVAKGLSTNPSLQEYLLVNGMSPYINGRSAGHSYHFNAELAIEYFKSKKEAGNIDHVLGTVESPKINEAGFVEGLTLDDGRFIDGDFFIDCTGFYRLLPKALDVKFESWKDWIFVDRAINFPIPIKENEKIPSWTLSKALPSGWLWKVPTFSRYGSGYIYSSDFISTDQAFDTLAKDYGATQYLQEIKFETGALEKGWVKNVMFSGLCAGFVEPMEATSLHSSLCNLLVFMKDYFRPDMDLNDDSLRDRYNNGYWKPYWTSVRDWILLHYLGGRQDSDFWLTIKHMKLPDSLDSLVNLWKYRMPRIIESSSDTVWQHTLTFGVAYGLGLLDPKIAKAELEYYDLYGMGEELYSQYKNIALELYKDKTDHRTDLERIRKCLK
jgi:hypothetical protein